MIFYNLSLINYRPRFLSEYATNNLSTSISTPETNLLTIDLFVCTCDEMSSMITKKGKIQTSRMHVPSLIPELYNIYNTKSLARMGNYLCYVKILDMFKNERFSFDEPNIDA